MRLFLFRSIIGSVYSMSVFGLDIYDFEYAYRVDGLHDPEKGLIFTWMGQQYGTEPGKEEVKNDPVYDCEENLSELSFWVCRE